MSSKDAKFGQVSLFNSSQFEFISDDETLMRVCIMVKIGRKPENK